MAAFAAFAFASLLLAVSHSTGSPQGQRGVRQIAAFRISMAPHRPLGGNLSSAALRPLPVLRHRFGSCRRLRAALRNPYYKPSLEEFSSCRVDVGLPVVSHLSLDGTEEHAWQCRPSGGFLCPGVASLACCFGLSRCSGHSPPRFFPSACRPPDFGFGCPPPKACGDHRDVC